MASQAKTVQRLLFPRFSILVCRHFLRICPQGIVPCRVLTFKKGHDKTQICNHAPSGAQNHSSSIPATKYIACQRWCSRSDWPDTVLLRRWNQGEWNRRAIRHAWRVQLVHHDCEVKISLGNLRVHRTIMLNLVLGRQAGRLWTRNEWFRTAFSEGTFEWVVDMWNLASLRLQSVQKLWKRGVITKLNAFWFVDSSVRGSVAPLRWP